MAIVAIVLMPFTGRALELSGGVMGLLGAALALVAVAGGLVGIFGGGASRRARIAAVEGALRAIVGAHASGDEEAFLNAAVFLLDNAFLPGGPTLALALDRADAAERLGPALERVVSIERTLLDTNEIQPVFSGV